MGSWVNLRTAPFVLNFRLVAHHMYTAFLWIWNAPILIESTVDESGSFVDKKIQKPKNPSKITDPELHKLVKLYQLYRHSKTCCSYKNEECRFHFGKFYSKQTIVAKSLPPDPPENAKHLVLIKRKLILSNVKDYIKLILI